MVWGFFFKKGQHPDLRSLSLLSLADRWAFLMEAAREAVSGTQLCPQDGWPTAGARVKLAPGLPRTSPAPSSFIQTAVSAPHSGQAPEGGWQRYLLDKILGLPWGAEVLPLPLFHPLLLFQAPLLLGGSVDVPQPQVLGHLPPQVPGDAWRRGNRSGAASRFEAGCPQRGRGQLGRPSVGVAHSRCHEAPGARI